MQRGHGEQACVVGAPAPFLELGTNALYRRRVTRDRASRGAALHRWPWQFGSALRLKNFQPWTPHRMHRAIRISDRGGIGLDLALGIAHPAQGEEAPGFFTQPEPPDQRNLDRGLWGAVKGLVVVGGWIYPITLLIDVFEWGL